MPIYDNTARERLADKLAYEIWLLEFLSTTQDLFQGGTDISTIKLTNREKRENVSISLSEHIGAGYAQRIMDAMAPLTFTVSYKVLDMVYEWVLEENLTTGIIKKVPWKFVDKVQVINSPDLTYPSLFGSNPYLRDYSYAFFTNLLPYRNEIVHNHNFSVSGDKITLTDSKAGNALTLDRTELGYLVRFVVAVAQCLAGKSSFDKSVDRLIRYHLDRLAAIHQLPIFNQKLPLLVNVELTVPKENSDFPADLRCVREQIERIHPSADVLFALLIIARDQNNVVAKWHFPAENVPNTDILNLTQKSYPEFLQN